MAPPEALTGRTPSCLSGAVLRTHLCEHPRFHALPGEAADATATAYVSQSTSEWDVLHCGRVTGRNVIAALGLSDRARLARAASANPSCTDSRGTRDAQCCAHNLRQCPLPARVPGLASDSASDATVAAFNSDLASYGSDRNAAFTEHQRIRYKATKAAERGIGAVRKLNGSVAENRAIAEVLHIFPKHTVQECGLISADTRSLSVQYNVQEDLLPAIGSSPDSLLIPPGSKRSDAIPIEIKSCTPYQAPNSGAYETIPRLKPFRAMSAMNVAQVMLAIAACNAESALFVCFAHEAVKIWKVERDDCMIEMMLHNIAAFNRKYLNNVPREGYADDLPFTASLVVQSCEVARNAQCIVDQRAADSSELGVQTQHEGLFLS